jgi:hypothetical protein
MVKVWMGAAGWLRAGRVARARMLVRRVRTVEFMEGEIIVTLPR